VASIFGSSKTDKRERFNCLTSNKKHQELSPQREEAGRRSLIRHPLYSLSGLIAEATRVYRAAREKKLDHAEARSLVWMLAQMRAMVETQALERLEARLEELAPSIEGKAHGYTGAHHPSRSAH
jgi:hypothetical protein